MKLVTTFAALELLGPDYRWRTDAYLDGPLVDGTLEGQPGAQGPRRPEDHDRAVAGVHARAARARPASASKATSCSTAARSGLPAHDAAPFDSEPLRPYNVGPDALLVNFKAVRFAFAPNAERQRRRREGRAAVAAGRARRRRRRSSTGPATTGGGSPAAAFISQSRAAAATFPGQLRTRRAASATGTSRCSTIRRYVHGMFRAYFAEAGGRVRRRGARRARAAGARRSPCSSRRRSTTSCAT